MTRRRDPNLQNIPIRTEEGRRIREAFRKEIPVDTADLERRIVRAPVWLRCSHFLEVLGVTVAECCNSCHEDEERCGVTMCSPSAPGSGLEAEVCCKALMLMELHTLRGQEETRTLWAQALRVRLRERRI